MTGIVLPEWVARNERRRRMLEDRSSGLGQTRYWNPLLREIDPRLELIFIGATDEADGTVPMRWHLRRRNETGPDSYWALVGPDGEFREMGSDVLEDFKGRDLWDSRVRKDLDDDRRRKLTSKERGRETRKEGRVDELAVNIRALDSPGVSFSDTAWSARPAGRRGRKR
jgi:hypothetical protein